MSATKKIKEISLDNAMSGMVLAKPILETSGTCLLPAQAELSEKSLYILKNRGVQHVTVIISSDDDVPEQDASKIDDKLKRIETLFRNSHQHDANRALMECLQRYRTRGHHDSPIDR